MATAEFDPETAYSLLANPRRRQVLDRFRRSRVWTVDELAAEVAAVERDVAVDAVDDDTHERFAISLVHNHLPRLADHGVVEWDQRSGDAVRADRFEALEPFLVTTLEGAGSVDATAT